MIPLSAYPPGNDHISHLWKREIILKTAFLRDVLVPRRVAWASFNSLWPFARPKRPPFKRFFRHPSKKCVILRISLLHGFFGGQNHHFANINATDSKSWWPVSQGSLPPLSLAARPLKVTFPNWKESSSKHPFSEAKMLNIGGVTSRFNRTMSLEMPEFENSKSFGVRNWDLVYGWSSVCFMYSYSRRFVWKV